jgi:hypothetical protein
VLSLQELAPNVAALRSAFEVLMLFFLPWGPGAPAGILVARQAGLGPVATSLLYLLSDVLTALILEPLAHWAGRQAGHRPRLAAVFRRMGQVSGGVAARLFPGRAGIAAGLALFSFTTDLYTAGIASRAVPAHRALAWAAVIAGDMAWFLLILATTLGLTRVIADDRLVFGGVLLIGLAAGAVAKRLGMRGRPTQSPQA